MSSIDVYKIEVGFIDFESEGIESIKQKYENYAGKTLNVSGPISVEWTDDHPLNMTDTCRETFIEMFKQHSPSPSPHQSDDKRVSYSFPVPLDSSKKVEFVSLLDQLVDLYSNFLTQAEIDNAINLITEK